MRLASEIPDEIKAIIVHRSKVKKNMAIVLSVKAKTAMQSHKNNILNSKIAIIYRNIYSKNNFEKYFGKKQFPNFPQITTIAILLQ